jgi:predicted dehydrogenase
MIGCGAMTEIAHLPAAMRSPMIEITALVDSDLDRANLLKRMFGCSAKPAARLEDVVETLDGVVIVTPNHTHRILTEVALQYGISAFVQKPLSTTYADAIAVCELARAKQLVLSVGFQGRHFASVKLMKRLIEVGFFGRIERFHCEYGVRGGYTSVSGYNLSREQAGGGVLVTMGSHYLDRMIYWFGEPREVRYADDNYGGVEGNCKGQIQFNNGIHGTFFFSKAIALKNKFIIETEQYVVELPALETEQITLFSRALPGTKMQMGASVEAGNVDYHQVELEDFAHSIRTGSPPVVNGFEGARSVKLSEELYACRTQLEEPWVWYRNPAMAGRGR